MLRDVAGGNSQRCVATPLTTAKLSQASRDSLDFNPLFSEPREVKWQTAYLRRNVLCQTVQHKHGEVKPSSVAAYSLVATDEKLRRTCANSSFGLFLRYLVHLLFSMRSSFAIEQTCPVQNLSIYYVTCLKGVSFSITELTRTRDAHAPARAPWMGRLPIDEPFRNSI